MIKLVGILVVAVGFACRLNTLLVVVVAGLATGMVAGMSFHEVVEQFGRFFVENRFITLPVLLMVPVVGLLERHGLQERVAALIRRARAATAGRVLWLYQFLRGISSMIGLSIGNHASTVRPLIVPMAESAALGAEGVKPLPSQSQAAPAAGAGGAGPGVEGRGLTPSQAEIRAHAAAAENVGNFFSDDIVVAIGALLLIKGFFDSVGVEVALQDIKLWSLPTALWVLVVGWWRYRVLDARLRRRAGRVAETAEAK